MEINPNKKQENRNPAYAALSAIATLATRATAAAAYVLGFQTPPRLNNLSPPPKPPNGNRARQYAPIRSSGEISYTKLAVAQGILSKAPPSSANVITATEHLLRTHYDVVNGRLVPKFS